jgi:NADH-quinone oxidoreductase subunit C
MDATTIAAALKELVPEAEFGIGAASDQPTLYVAGERLVETCRALHDAPDLAFVLLSDMTGVDWWPNEPRFEVVYHLASFDHRTRLRLKVRLGGDAAHLADVQEIWPVANWLEREVWDLFGIVFDGHNDLRRLLMPEDWDGHPARKDYPVQIKMTPKVYEPLQLSAEQFRANIEADRHRRPAPAADRPERPKDTEAAG